MTEWKLDLIEPVLFFGLQFVLLMSMKDSDKAEELIWGNYAGLIGPIIREPTESSKTLSLLKWDFGIQFVHLLWMDCCVRSGPWSGRIPQRKPRPYDLRGKWVNLKERLESKTQPCWSSPSSQRSQKSCLTKRDFISFHWTLLWSSWLEEDVAEPENT